MLIQEDKEQIKESVQKKELTVEFFEDEFVLKDPQNKDWSITVTNQEYKSLGLVIIGGQS